MANSHLPIALLALIFTASWLSLTIATPASGYPETPIETKSPLCGVLYRYNTTSAERENVLLGAAAKNNLDVWQHTSTYIDFYLPSSGASPPPELPAELLLTSYPVQSCSAPPSATSASEASWILKDSQRTSFHEAYHPLFEIDAFIHDLEHAYPERVSVKSLGTSAEGREVRGVTISSGNNGGDGGSGEEVGSREGDEGWVMVDGSEDDIDEDVEVDNNDERQTPFRSSSTSTRHHSRPPKLGFVILGAQHAREWIATSTALYLIHSLAANSTFMREEHSSSKSLLDYFDFHFIPVPNPDEYAYTWEHDRFWYKNRQIIGPSAKCVGLDMNRNWGYKWRPTAEQDTLLPQNNQSFSTSEDSDLLKRKPPTDPCSHWYPGHRPFESPEVESIANWMTTLPNLVGFVDLRSYGQMLSTPYSYTCKRASKDDEDLLEAAHGATHALKSAHGTMFKTGSLCKNLYAAPGNIVDWMYARVGIKYSYVAHLRDTGTYGFSLPEKWIRPVGEETGNMIEYIATFIGRKMKSKC